MNPNNPSAYSTFQPHPGLPSTSSAPGYLPLQHPQQQQPQPQQQQQQQQHLQGQAPHPSQQPSFYPHPNPNPNLHPQQPPPHSNPYSQVQPHGKAPPSQMQHPVQQQQHQQPEPQQQLQQQQHAFGARSMQTGGPSGAMMPGGMPQHQSGPHQNFSAPQYHQSAVPTTLGQQPTPQRQQSYPSSSQQTQPQNMAAVSGPGNAFPSQMRPASQTVQTQNAPQSAPSPEAAAREKARVTVLLNINSSLLQEVINLQAAGKAGMPSNQPGSNQTSPTDQSPSSPMSTVDSSKQNALNNARSGSDASKASASGTASKPSQEYIDCMRRLQANLAYLASIADRAKKTGGSTPQGPAIMTPPPTVTGMNELYAKLNELFPNANKAGAAPAQQQPQQPQPQPQPQQHAQQQQQQQMSTGLPQALPQGAGPGLGLAGEATG